jgi:predicted RNA-binding Zn-ribbon protein involved in translation (DUF1610 family)
MQPRVYKTKGCHPKEFEAQAEDLVEFICEKCGAILISPDGIRKQKNQYADWLDKIPNFIKRIYIR